MNASTARAGTVYLVGAGPGDPELLTLRALRLLESADVIFHDDLVPDEVLALAHRHALITSVGKRCGRPRITQAEIHTLMIDSALAGRSVVRLKSGDPLVFGRAGEEIAALRAAKVPFEVVPGVTAAFAAGAALSLPLTDRKRASKLILCTGHHAADKQSSQPLWQGPLPDDATLAIYMPGRDTSRIAQELAATGLAPDIPCCAISHAATPRQSYATARLGKLATLACGPAPLLLLVGRAMEPLFHAERDKEQGVTMTREIWVGLAELCSSPVEDARVQSRGKGSRGKGSLTWWACWATDVSSFEAKVSDVSQGYGLFVAGFENVMTYKEADRAGLVGDELAEMAKHASQDENFCILGTQYQHGGDH